MTLSGTTGTGGTRERSTRGPRSGSGIGQRRGAATAPRVSVPLGRRIVTEDAFPTRDRLDGLYVVLSKHGEMEFLSSHRCGFW